MNLSGAIVEHQNSLVQFYMKLAERFEENSIIRTLWHEMAGDVSEQIQSIKSLPPSFWNQLKNAPDGDIESTVNRIPSPPADVADISIRGAFEISLQLTEPVILKIYSRAIRLLRKNSTAPALNFYILVKAYVAKLARTTDSFAGDPLLIRRAQMLLLGFEKEVQAPAPEIKSLASRTPSLSAHETSVTGKTIAKATKETTQKPLQNVKTDESKPAKAAQVKIKTSPVKKPATNKRA